MKVMSGLLCALIPLITACDETGDAAVIPGGDAKVGRELIGRFGCGTCHVIPGVPQADGLVGPPLTNWSRRVYLAGRYPNRPEHLIRWLMNPPGHAPATAMPDLGLTRGQARDIAAYLYELE